MKVLNKLLALLPLLASCSGAKIIEVCSGYCNKDKETAYCEHYEHQDKLNQEQYSKINNMSVMVKNKTSYYPNDNTHLHYFYVERK